MAVVCPGGAIGVGGANFRPAFAIVASDDQSLPRLTGDLLHQLTRGPRHIQVIPFRSFRWQAGWWGSRRLGFNQQILTECHADLGPASVMTHETAEWLGVEQLVGKHHQASRQCDRLSAGDDFVFAKRVRDVAQDAGSRFRPDFHESEFPGILPAEEGHGSSRNQFTEHVSGCGCGVEIGFTSVADALSRMSVIADFRMIKRQLHEISER